MKIQTGPGIIPNSAGLFFLIQINNAKLKM